MNDDLTPPTPRKRITRTIWQTVIAVCLAVPAAVALVPDDPSDGWKAWIIGATGGLVVLVSAATNLRDERAGRG